MTNLRLLCCLLLIATLAACGGNGTASGTGSGFLALEMTDAPIDPALVEEARIAIDKITVHGNGDAQSGFTTIYEGPAVDVDLFQLRNGVTRSLVVSQLDAGTYGQVRLFFSDAYLRLTNGNEYTIADDTLRLPSAPSGLKVMINPGVEIVDAASTTLLLDIDLTRTFRPEPANDALNAERYHLHPVLRAANLSNSGEIRGLVSEDDGNGLPVGVDRAAVYVLQPGETDLDLAVAATVTEQDGFYAFLGLEPDDYDVVATNAGRSARHDGVTVSAGSARVVDFTLE